MKKLLFILSLFATVTATAQTTRHGHFSGNPVYTPANNDIIALSAGSNIVKDSVVRTVVSVTTLNYQLPANPSVGERITIQTGQSVATVKFTSGTLFKPITSTKAHQNITLTYNSDGKWH